MKTKVTSWCIFLMLAICAVETVEAASRTLKVPKQKYAAFEIVGSAGESLELKIVPDGEAGHDEIKDSGIVLEDTSDDVLWKRSGATLLEHDYLTYKVINSVPTPYLAGTVQQGIRMDRWRGWAQGGDGWRVGRGRRWIRCECPL